MLCWLAPEALMISGSLLYYSLLTMGLESTIMAPRYKTFVRERTDVLSLTDACMHGGNTDTVIKHIWGLAS